MIVAKFPNKGSFPIIIGGVGGSGTRLFAEALHTCGLRTARDINRATDAMGCTLLYKRPSVFDDLEESGTRFDQLWNITESAIIGDRRLSRDDLILMRRLANESRPMHSTFWLKARAGWLRREARDRACTGRWFLKEPNLHWVAPRILEIDSDIRFVMVVRHGVDMAFSGNQQQRWVWGPTVLEDPDLEMTPNASLRYWCLVHRRIAEFQRKHQDRVLILSFDQFCTEPDLVAHRLLEFAAIEPTTALLEQVKAGVKAPKSIGRHLQEDLSQFEARDREFVDSFMSTIKVS